jgi:hypothetical protein
VVSVVEGIGETVVAADDTLHVVAGGLLEVVDRLLTDIFVVDGSASLGVGTWSLVVSDRLLVVVADVDGSLMVISLDIVAGTFFAAAETLVVATNVFGALDIARVEDISVAVEPPGVIGGVVLDDV